MPHQLLLDLHILFAVVAVGTVAMNAILFLYAKFTKLNQRFNAEERYLTFTPVISSTIWVSLILLSVTGVLLFLEQPEFYAASEKFHLKMILVLVLFVEGVLMSLMMPPRLHKEHHELVPQRVHEGIMMLGIVSIVTWYGAFFLGWTKTFPWSTSQGLMIYLGLLLALFIAMFPVALKLRRIDPVDPNSTSKEPMV